MSATKKYWLVAREFSGIAEAGGVKDVVSSLANGFVTLNWDVTVFIPFYGCTDLKALDTFVFLPNHTIRILIESKEYTIRFFEGYCKGVRLVFVNHSIFFSKRAVYTYTKLEELHNPLHVSGCGHLDANLMSAIFQRAVVAFGLNTYDYPLIFHCHDAHAACIPFLVHTSKDSSDFYEHTRFFITIHNAGTAYRAQFNSVEEASLLFGRKKYYFLDNCINSHVEPFLLSQPYAQFLTVSPWYAKELLTYEESFNDDISKYFVQRHFSIHGITNGIDYFLYDPTNTACSMLPYSFNPLIGDFVGKYACRTYFLEKYVHPIKTGTIEQHGYFFDDTEDVVYFCFHGRLVHQKGVDVLGKAAEIVLEEKRNVRFVVIGQGTNDLETEQCVLAKKYEGRYIYFQGYETALSRLSIAISDYIILPSFFEPCGLMDFIAQIYGTIPIAHASGGLQKIIDGKTGCLYEDNNPLSLAKKLLELIALHQIKKKTLQMMRIDASNHVKDSYNWQSIIKRDYLPLFLEKK